MAGVGQFSASALATVVVQLILEAADIHSNRETRKCSYFFKKISVYATQDDQISGPHRSHVRCTYFSNFSFLFSFC